MAFNKNEHSNTTDVTEIAEQLNAAPNNAAEPKKKKKKRKKKKKKGVLGLLISIVIVLILMTTIVAALVGGLSFVKDQLDKITKTEVSTENLAIDDRVAKELDGYRNIALIGIDARDMESDENTRSDAMIIVSIEKATGEIRLISLYRDTYLDLGYGLDKLTHAYFYGGVELTVQSINKNLDLNCREFMVVNWKSVADAVDCLGGVEIDIQESEIKEMNKYIPETARTTGGKKTKIKKAGKQTLNGAQAVTYARIRKDSAEGDHRRNERMKILVAAAFDKVKTTSISDLEHMADVVLPQIKTNMGNDDFFDLLLDFGIYTMSDSASWPYDWTDFIYNGIWYGPPVTLQSNVIELHEKFFDQKDYEPTETVQNISTQISQRTGRW